MRDIPMERPVGSCVGLMLREGSRIEREIWNHPYVDGTSSYTGQRKKAREVYTDET